MIVAGFSNFQGLLEGSISLGSFALFVSGFIAFLAAGVMVDGLDLENGGRTVFLRICSTIKSGVISLAEYLWHNLVVISEEVGVIQGSLGSVQASKPRRTASSALRDALDKLSMSSMVSKPLWTLFFSSSGASIAMSGSCPEFQ